MHLTRHGGGLRVEDERQLADNLDKSWEQLKREQGNRDLPDIICLDDVDAEWTSFRNRLVSRVTSGQYAVTHVDVLDLPKDQLNVRPLAWLTLEDRLIYDACVLAMTPTIDAAIPNNVYSYRWSKFKRALYSPKGRWIEMQRRARRFNKANQELLLLRTDVTSFYEYVDFETLISDLRSHNVPEWALALLDDFLTQFNSLSSASGLPQGADSSGVLANLYLLPVDAYLRREGLMHLRYSDDIMVFGSDWLALRKCLLRVNRIFRSRHLCLSASKTKIVPAWKVSEEFADTSKDAIRYNIDIALPSSGSDLKSYFQEVISTEPLSVRDLRFALNQLRRIEDDEAVSWLLDNMSELPHVAREAIQYLKAFREQRLEIDGELAATLANGDFDLYPSVERRIINYLVFEGIEDTRVTEVCWSIVQDSGREIVRDFAARYLGRFSSPGDGARLRELFERESSAKVKRALLIAYYDTGECPRRLLTSLSNGNTFLGITARFLRDSPAYLSCPDPEVA
jgi:hypothetical protein